MKHFGHSSSKKKNDVSRMTLTKMPSILIRQNDGQFSHSMEIFPLKRPRYSEIRTQNIVFCWQYCQRRCSTNHTKSSFPWEIESPASGKKWTVRAKCVNKTNIETLFEMIQILENLNLTKGTLIQCIWGFTFFGFMLWSDSSRSL